MKRRLPPFAAVRAFEAAARHQSFKAAAEELHVTQSAISHQVKGLEKFLDTTLFQRHANGVELNPSGREYMGSVTSALDNLSASTEKIRGTDICGPLSVRATPAFIARWLLPRMDSFSASHPEIDIELTTTNDPTYFPGNGVDILIQYGDEPVEGIAVEPFLWSTRYPVCSPELLKNGLRIETPEDLSRTTLLRDIIGDQWDIWFACAHSKLPEYSGGPRLAHCDFTLRAAQEGLGVALAYHVFIPNELADGTLVRLFDDEIPSKAFYSLSCPESWVHRPKIAAFRNWMLSQSKADG